MNKRILKKKALLELKGVDIVKIEDLSDYDPESCNNGGCYSFWTKYVREGNNVFRVEYGTSADFSYCPVCGSFGDHYDWESEEYECGDFSRVSALEVYKDMLGASRCPNMFVEVR